MGRWPKFSTSSMKKGSHYGMSYADLTPKQEGLCGGSIRKQKSYVDLTSKMRKLGPVEGTYARGRPM